MVVDVVVFVVETFELAGVEISSVVEVGPVVELFKPGCPVVSDADVVEQATVAASTHMVKNLARMSTQ